MMCDDPQTPWKRGCLMKRLMLLGTLVSTSAKADILEERIFSGGRVLVPSTFTLNPAATPTNLTIFSLSQQKLDGKTEYTMNPNNDGPRIEQKVTSKDLIIGGQIPMQGAAFGFSYDEFQKNFIVRHEQRNEDNKEHFFNRDYRMRFAVDLTPEIRGAFTFHYTSLQADLDGNFFIDDTDRSHYKGNLSGYGIGVNAALGRANIGLFSLPPMRGKATVDGEQKIVTEPGIYGTDGTMKLNDSFAILGHYHRWSYKHDERDDTSQSPTAQRSITLRGLELEQFLRKTSAYGFGLEGTLNSMVFGKFYYQRQESVFLFDGSKVPGDDPDIETGMHYTELNALLSIRKGDFVAELSLMKVMNAKVDSIRGGRGEMGMGSGADYERNASRVGLMLGAAF